MLKRWKKRFYFLLCECKRHKRSNQFCTLKGYCIGLTLKYGWRRGLFPNHSLLIYISYLFQVFHERLTVNFFFFLLSFVIGWFVYLLKCIGHQYICFFFFLLAMVVLSNLEPNTTYEIRVAAVNGKGQGDYSKIEIFQTLPVRKYASLAGCFHSLHLQI